MNRKLYKYECIIINMKRKRTIKKYGDSHAIHLEPADLKDFDLKCGDQVVIDEIYKSKEGKR